MRRRLRNCRQPEGDWGWSPMASRHRSGAITGSRIAQSRVRYRQLALSSSDPGPFEAGPFPSL
jgi:hypothetical protein